jgi:hypothetical protein
VWGWFWGNAEATSHGFGGSEGMKWAQWAKKSHQTVILVLTSFSTPVLAVQELSFIKTRCGIKYWAFSVDYFISIQLDLICYISDATFCWMKLGARLVSNMRPLIAVFLLRSGPRNNIRVVDNPLLSWCGICLIKDQWSILLNH